MVNKKKKMVNKRLHLNDSYLFLFIIYLEVNRLFKAKLIRFSGDFILVEAKDMTM